jgi:hypothetical protein
MQGAVVVDLVLVQGALAVAVLVEVPVLIIPEAGAVALQVGAVG